MPILLLKLLNELKPKDLISNGMEFKEFPIIIHNYDPWVTVQRDCKLQKYPLWISISSIGIMGFQLGIMGIQLGIMGISN